MDIWKQLARPIYCLAPMEGVTDTVFRQLVDSCGRPGVKFTEFVNVDGLQSAGRNETIKGLYFNPSEKPLVAQIWGLEPNNFYKSAQDIVEMGFDGIDLNMGCPVKKIVSKGACSKLIENPPLAKEIIQATKEGAGGIIPVSVKTRIGFNKIVTEEWAEFLLDQEIDALIVHGRTSRQMSKVPCNWKEIGKVVALRDRMKKDTAIIGNGDVMSLDQADELVQQWGVDGVMIGRGIFQNPWLFNREKPIETISRTDRLELMQHHLNLFDQIWKDDRPFVILKRYFKIYLKEFEGAARLREQVMESNNLLEVREIIHQAVRN